MMKILISWTCLLVLTGCSPEPNMLMQSEQRMSAASIPAGTSQRVTVERIGVFRDDVAYNNTRGIYIILDTETGREFIGVSGVGIAETGSHQAGKTRISDER